MNREIKFRAWNKNINKMIYPLCIRWDKLRVPDKGESLGFLSPNLKVRKGLSISEEPFPGKNVMMGNNNVDALVVWHEGQRFSSSDDFILMQYIEKIDKNDIDIYEGDIVQCEQLICTVTWENARFIFLSEDDHDIEFSYDYKLEHWEKIGNIYEN